MRKSPGADRPTAGRRRGPGRPAPAGSASSLLDLQRSAGNRAVIQALRPSGGRGPLTVQRADDPGVGPQPQIGGAPLDLKDAYALRYVYRELAPAVVKKLKKDVVEEQMAAAIADTKADPNYPFDPPASDARLVVDGFKAHLDAAPYDNSLKAYLDTWNDASLAAVPSRFTLLNKLFDRLRSQLVPKARADYKRLDLEIDARLRSLRPEAGRLPSAQVKAQFAAALKGLPGLKELIADIKANAAKGRLGASAPKMVIGEKESTWQDGGKLVDKIVKEPAGATEAVAVDTDAELTAMKEKVQKADNFYRSLVERDVLGKIARPTIVYHLVSAFDRVGASVDSNGKSAYVANQAGTKVNVGQGVFPHIVVHEVGHYIEDNLPRSAWLDIELLLRARHDEGGGGALVAGPGGARQRGSYPATGDYTSRAYTTGTEVTSMTLENLSQAGNIDNLIDQDPQQVAVVIRSLRPGAYAAYQPLRAFDKLLP